MKNERMITLAMLVTLIVMAVSAQAGVLLSEDFDSYMPGDFPTGWILVWNGASPDSQKVTDEQSYSPPNSFVVHGRAPSNSAVCQYLIPSQPTVITFGARVLVEAGAVTAPLAEVCLWNRDEYYWGVYYCRVRFENSTITLDGDYLMPYNRNQWYDVKVEYSDDTRRASVWIDGVLKADQWSVYTGGVGYNALALCSGHGGLRCYFDDVGLSTPDQPLPHNWNTISSGGGPGSSPSFGLNGTVVQTAVSLGTSTNFGLSHGFWREYAGSTGSSCCVIRGDINHDGSPEPDIADLVHLVTYMFQDGSPPICDEPYGPECSENYYPEADVDGNGTCYPDIADLVYLVTYMFQGGPPPVACP